ncbi:MAG: D-alanine--D-alanine ligase [archaeon]|jgi:D-alanine-D-alanine ligase
MQRIKVAVLRGGPGTESEVSFKTGKNVIDNLPDKYVPVDVFISRSGEWHLDGVAISPAKLFSHIDVVFNALHGEYGEDGEIQKLLDQFKVKYTGSTALASALGMNKAMAKKIFVNNGLKTPVFAVVKKKDDINFLANDIFKTFPMPAIVKPNGSGSSVGVSIVRMIKDIVPALKEAFKHSEIAIVEEFISGKEATCGVIEKFKGQDIYSLLPIEITKPKEYEFFNYDAKYSGKSKEICPGNFSKEESKTMQEMAKLAHKVLGLRHYSRSDFIVHPKRGVYILEANTLPGLTKESLLPVSLEALGVSMSQFLDHVLTLALGK